MKDTWILLGGGCISDIEGVTCIAGVSQSAILHHNSIQLCHKNSLCLCISDIERVTCISCRTDTYTTISKHSYPNIHTSSTFAFSSHAHTHNIFSSHTHAHTRNQRRWHQGLASSWRHLASKDATISILWSWDASLDIRTHTLSLSIDVQTHTLSLSPSRTIGTSAATLTHTRRDSLFIYTHESRHLNYKVTYKS